MCLQSQSLSAVLQSDIVGVEDSKKVNTVHFMQHVLSMDKSVARREAVPDTFFAVFNLLLFYSTKIIVADFCL